MADVRDREALRAALEPTLGAGPTALLLEHLPPMPTELATKADLLAFEERLEERFTLRLDALEHRLLAAFRGELTQAVTSQTRTVVFSTLGAIVSLGGLALVLASLG